MATNCKFCGAPVPAEKRDCQACGEDNGAPNVRIAALDTEKEALRRRLDDAKVSASARGCCDVLERFGAAVVHSKAVIARTLADVQDIVEKKRTYTSFHRQLASNSRLAEENDYDATRIQLDAALFPNFHAEILFASLSLDGQGMSGYGPYVMILRENLIARRASVFEENLYDLIQRKGLLLGKPLPPGYRAVWDERHLLAMAKMQSELTRHTLDSEFPAILAADRGGTGNSSFIEVHIYGPLNRFTIEKVLGPRPRTKQDRLIAESLDRKLNEVGATLEIT